MAMEMVKEWEMATLAAAARQFVQTKPCLATKRHKRHKKWLQTFL
jgi:hypothetical protein